MTAVILAGGLGTRLRPVTYVYNKHLALVYDKPMIYYPIKTLKDMGFTDIIIVSGGDHIGGFTELLKDGRDLGVNIAYRVQPEAGGIAQALSAVEGFITGVFPVILGDNYFESAPVYKHSPMLWVKTVDNPERFGVYHDGQIIEKPSRPPSDKAVVGMYLYDETVFDYIRTLQPSARGELEITDVNNWYLSKGCEVREYDGYWSDMGTFDSLLEVANRVK